MSVSNNTGQSQTSLYQQSGKVESYIAPTARESISKYLDSTLKILTEQHERLLPLAQGLSDELASYIKARDSIRHQDIEFKAEDLVQISVNLSECRRMMDITDNLRSEYSSPVHSSPEQREAALGELSHEFKNFSRMWKDGDDIADILAYYFSSDESEASVKT